MATFSKNDSVPALNPPSARDVHGADELADSGDQKNADGGVGKPAEAEAPPVADLINRIEVTIVQQLLYTVPSKKLPKTRLKRIAQSSKRPYPLDSPLAKCVRYHRNGHY
ncbi:hypothetical protein [Pseudomonas sp. 21LCFQ010]|uniref:YobI family P-loop NTPase n=1 Tax=Pseudomonas sp. 21LCFQ010 TaxID=2957506 RepID=UPI003455952B